MDLTSENVENVFKKCLFGENEDTKKATIVEGIMRNFGFNPEAIEKHSDDIGEMLAFLPDSFKKDGGGGMSFLNACETKDGVQWTGLHSKMEALFVLGMAVGRVRSLMHREMWSAMPGGMPYYVVEV